MYPCTTQRHIQHSQPAHQEAFTHGVKEQSLWVWCLCGSQATVSWGLCLKFQVSHCEQEWDLEPNRNQFQAHTQPEATCLTPGPPLTSPGQQSWLLSTESLELGGPPPFHLTADTGSCLNGHPDIYIAIYKKYKNILLISRSVSQVWQKSPTSCLNTARLKVSLREQNSLCLCILLYTTQHIILGIFEMPCSIFSERFLFYVYGCSVCLYVCILHVCNAHRGLKRVSDPPKLKFQSLWTTYHVDAGNWIQAHWKHRQRS